MQFTKTTLEGAYIIEPQKFEDERGMFARTWCRKEFEAHGLVTNMVQSNISLSKNKGTLRGLHYQSAPYAEAKLMRCTKGAIYDVCIDLRQDSETYKQWFGVELTEKNYRMLYVPEGFAHGYEILEDNTEVFYLVSEFYHPEAEKGVRWNDPCFQIDWPIKTDIIISDKDKCWPDFSDHTSK